MKRVLFCAFLCLFLISTVSAVIPPQVQPINTPAPTPQVTVKAVQFMTIKPDIHVSIQPGVSPTEAPFGSLEIKSNPPGSEIWMFGNKTPYFTPFYEPKVYPYTYYLVLKYPGYEPYSEVVIVQSGQAVVVSAALVPLSSVTTQPVVSQTPLSQTDSIPTNTPATQQVQGQTTSSESTGSLSITTTPAGAEVSVDNEVKGISPAMISGLSPGTHALKITKAGYQDFSTTISIEAGKVRQYSTGLTSASMISATTPANSIGFPVFAAIIALIGLVIVRKKSR